MRNLIITLPAKNKWEDYSRELQAVADRSMVLNFKIPSMPKESGPGARCYLVHRGVIVGYMEIADIVVRDGFTCDSSGKEWDAGIYVQRHGPFHFFLNPPEHRGFQSYHYYDVLHGKDQFAQSLDGQHPGRQTTEEKAAAIG